MENEGEGFLDSLTHMTDSISMRVALMLAGLHIFHKYSKPSFFFFLERKIY